MDILLTGSFDDAEREAWHRELKAALPEAVWHLAPSPQVEAAVVANPSPGVLQGMPRLQFVQSLWAGVDRLLADPTVPPGLPIARMVDPAMNAAMAETALWAVLSLHRGFFDYARQQREERWQALPQRRSREVSVAVLGLGQMGTTVARRLAAQGYDVHGWSRSGARTDAAGPADDASVPLHAGADALPALLAHSDIVIDLLPLTPATRGMFDRRLFDGMRRGSALVNLARGAHVVDDDLLAALSSGQLGYAVLDVFPQEPLPAGHAYWRHPRISVLPHVAALTDPRSAAAVVAQNVRAWFAGRAVAHLVDRSRGY